VNVGIQCPNWTYTLRNKGTVRVQLSTLRYKFHKCASKGTNMYPAEYKEKGYTMKYAW